MRTHNPRSVVIVQDGITWALWSAVSVTVAIDEAHSNFHTAGGQYKPFADLLTNDGYRVIASTGKFEIGMNVSGNDDRQFALNVLHWLSRLLK